MLAENLRKCHNFGNVLTNGIICVWLYNELLDIYKVFGYPYKMLIDNLTISK